MSKTLIAYFSHKGNNYVNGNIVNLAVGNTKIAAEKIKSITGGDLFEIKTVNPYSEDYKTCVAEAKKDMEENARPKLTDTVKNMSDYDTIYLGYPNWCKTMPMGVFTFLESYNFKGKTILPFCTHAGSGAGESEADIKKLCPDSNVLSTLELLGSDIQNSYSDIKNWIDKLNKK